MAEVWFWLLAIVLSVYFVLDGFDFGVGVLHFVIGKDVRERATLLRSIGSVWDGNEVWLVALGGSLFGAFPVLYASAFSGFYLPLMIVLWLLIFRALGIELRHQLDDPLWHQFWDVAFSGASALLAVVFGAALGNLVRGVPIDAGGQFFEPLWTDFRVGAETGILDWYTASVALAALVTLAHHGALWIALKTEGALAGRAVLVARRLFPVTLLLGVLLLLATLFVQPQARSNLQSFAGGGLLPVIAIAGLVSSRIQLGSRPLHAFLGSSVYVFFQILSAAFAIFPQALAARDPAHHLSVRAAAASPEALRTMLIWWVPGMLIAIGYSMYAYGKMPKTFRETDSVH